MFCDREWSLAAKVTDKGKWQQ